MKKALNISIWFLFVIATLFLLSFTQSKKNNLVCNNWEINVDSFSGNYFVTPDRITTLLQNMGLKKGETKIGDEYA